MAIHPDDPPFSPMFGVARILLTPADMKRVVNIVDSPANGITLCQGCFSQMGADIPGSILEFADKINFVHMRDVVGNGARFCEAFPDAGQTNMFEAIKAYRSVGYTGYMRADHVPAMEGEEGPAHGYTMLGRLFAVGYIRGLLDAARVAKSGT